MVSPQNPPGWSLNPSSWSQRLPIVALALAGAGIATHLLLYQLRIVEGVWEPFFGMGSAVLLNSVVWSALPVSTVPLGATGYLLAALTGLIGGRRRWRTRPWIVVVFGLVVGPLGAVTVLLTILQSVLLGAWCTLCLASALVSILMIGPAMDEILAALQHIRRESLRGGSAWRTMWGMKERRRDWLEAGSEDEVGEDADREREARRAAAVAEHGERRRAPRPVALERWATRTRPAQPERRGAAPRRPEGKRRMTESEGTEGPERP